MKKLATLLFIYLYSANISGQSISIQWQKAFGGAMYDYGKEIETTSDGGYITTGYSESSDGDIFFNHGGGDWWVVKSNSLGSIQWEKTYGGTGYDYGYSIKQTADGGYIVAGYSESADGDVTGNHGGGDCWVIKLDTSGVVQWQKTYGGTLSDNAQCIRETNDGGYIICGYSESFDGDVTGNHGGGDCWIFKLDNSGTLEWEKTLGGSSYDFGQGIKQTSDGGYILTGGTNSNDGDVIGQNGNGDCWIVKLDNAGNIIWQNSLGGTNYDFGQSIEETIDDGYIIAGYSESVNGDVFGSYGGGDCWVVKCDNLGNLIWQKTLGSSGNDYGFCIQQINDGGYILTGYSELNDGDVTGNHGNYDCWVVKLDESGNSLMQKSFGGTGVDIGYSIRQITNGSFIIVGYSESNDGDITGDHGGGDCWVVRLSESSLGMEDNSLAQTISISPNPSSGNFNVSGLENGNRIEFYDISGKVIFQTKVSGSNYSLDLTDKARGIYFYRVNMKNGKSSTGKIILN